MTFFGCKTSPESNKKNIDTRSRITELTKMYESFYEIEDYQSSIYTLQCILFLDSTKTEYYDSLVFHYAKAGNFKATEKMIAKSLEFGKNIKVMEYSAIISSQKGEFETSIKKLDELFDLTKDYKYKVSVFSMKLESGDVKGSENMLAELEGLENLDSISIEQVISETETQTVPLKAAILLGKGQIEAFVNRDVKKSLQYIKKSLEIKPDFQNALALREKIIQATQGGRR